LDVHIPFIAPPSAPAPAPYPPAVQSPPMPFPHRPRLQRFTLAAGGTLLAAIAGYANTVVLLDFRIPISHATGNVTHLGLDALDLDVRGLALGLGAVGGFFVGAVVSGVVIGSPQLRIGRRYGVALLIEAALLAAAAALTAAKAPPAVVLAAMGCGLQNAMASSYRGLIVRTTHVTGILTDLGFGLGRAIRGQPVPPAGVGFLALLLGGFALGSALGFAAHASLGPAALLPPAAACALAGTAYLTWRTATADPTL